MQRTHMKKSQLQMIYGFAALVVLVLLWRLTAHDPSAAQRLECKCGGNRAQHVSEGEVGTKGSNNNDDSGAQQEDDAARAALPRRASTAQDTCQDGYFLSHLLSRFIDIDFIEFVLSSQPSPPTAPIVDIGIYQAGELIHMAQQGFRINAFEPNPHRYNACMAEIHQYKPEVQERIKLNNLAVSDSAEPLHFQLAGLDSHLYFVDESKGEMVKEKSIIVPTVPISKVVTNDTYFVKIDTQGFDTKILESLLSALEQSSIVVPFIQFEFSPHFEVTRARRSKEDHKKLFRRLIDAGYDVYQGAAVQPWIHSHRSKYGKTPLAMLAVDQHMPTCVDDFVERMHEGRGRPIFPGKTSTSYGTWMDILAVRRMRQSPFYRHTGWVLSRRM